MADSNATVLALDVGEKRIGVARAYLVARIANPLTTLDNEPGVLDRIAQLATDEAATAVVVGLPRNLSGEATAQTGYVESFGKQLQPKLSVPLYWQDEAVTSQKAEAELTARGKQFAKAEVDALAATYILEDFLREPPQEFQHG